MRSKIDPTVVPELDGNIYIQFNDQMKFIMPETTLALRFQRRLSGCFYNDRVTVMECKRNEMNGEVVGKMKRKRNSTAKPADSTLQTPDVNDNLRSPKRPRTDGDDLRFSSKLLDFYLYGQNSKCAEPFKGAEAETKTVKYPPGMLPCVSSIPGCSFGVHCSRFVPVGTWIGPFEGEVIRPEELTADRENGHMWEMYKDGNLSHYVDGNDTKFSNWLSKIQCARHKGEQNMTVFQYNGNLYYRAFRDILPYTELLVWYDDRYSDSMDIERISMAAGCDPLFPKVSAINAYERSYRYPGIEHLEQVGDVLPNDYFALSSLNETNQWRCGQCEQTFSQRVALQMHVCDRSPEKPFQCGQCPASFSNSDELRGHVVEHVSDKPFKCGYCGRTFSGSTTLGNHIRTHTGERPFKCRKCGKCFSQSTQLSRHHRSREKCVEK